MEPSVRARVVIVDDHPIFRHGLRQIIESTAAFAVAGEAGDGEQGLSVIDRVRPDVAVVDIDMPKMDGFQVARAVRQRKAAPRIVLLTLHGEPEFVDEALNLGVAGYVLKESAADEIAACLRSVMAGHTYLSPTITQVLVNRRKRAAALVEAQPGLETLTAAERKVLRLVADYKTSKEIGDELFIHYRTVENHRRNICLKLGLSGSHALVKFALRHKSELL